MLDDTYVQSLVDTSTEISLIGDFRKSHKKQCTNLVRRIKLLVPLFEEVKELERPIPDDAISSLKMLHKALQSAKDLLGFCHNGSKLYLVLEGDVIGSRFRAVSEELDKALDALPHALLDISDEVREQVELVHTQLKRAKGRADTQDMELLVDIMTVASQKDVTDEDLGFSQRLADELQLRTQSEIKEENEALQRLIKEKGMEDESLEQISSVLRKLKALGEPEIIELETLDLETSASQNVAASEQPSTPVVPEDFRCPVSLELMKDPVIVATGQTYDRSSIQKWLDSGHKTCPKTQQSLPHLVLTPNYVLRSLIAQWCEANGVEVPKRVGQSSRSKLGDISAEDRAIIDVLLQKLCSGQIDVHRAAAGELRLLAKRSAENRVCIAEAGAIPVLVNLLSTQDRRTQEHAVTALLNLSIHDNNKGVIVQAGAIGPIVEVLKHGSMEARENAAATLFSLSVVDENKITIGASGAIPALVDLLRDGSSRGKKDAATALFNLSIYQGNKARAVRAGVVDPLMKLIDDQSAGMVDEALAIIAILATHPEGRAAIGNASAVPMLVDLICNGSPRNKENAAAVLLALSNSDSNHLVTARQLGVYQALIELVQNGTTRARRKATTLLEHLNRQEKVEEAI